MTDLPTAGVSDPMLRALVDALASSGPLTRVALMRETGWARSTVSRVVGSLLDAHFLVEADGSRTGGRGRPVTTLSLNPTFGVAVGLDFGFRHVRGILADATHVVRARHQVDLVIDYTPAEGFAAAAEIVHKLTEVAAVARSDILGIGAAIPAPVDMHTGHVSVSGMLPSWGGVDVRSELARAIGFPVRIDNDTKMAAYGELRWGVARGLPDFLYLKLHSGVGGAAVVNGQLVHGSTGAAGHFGHISTELNGPLCRCGSRGCLEVYAGVPAILDALASVHGTITLNRALQLRQAGDPASVRVINEISVRVGQVAGFLCNAFNPEAIVIGGALSAAFDYLKPGIEAGLADTAQPVNRSTRVVLGALAHEASAMGALGIALNHGLVERLGP